MGVRPIAVALMFLSLAAAGCIGGGKDEAPAASSATNGTATNATCFDSCKNLIAFEETNKTESGAGGVDHHHDYWNGKERLAIFEVPAAMDPFPDSSGVFATFRPPQGKFIFEGTETVEFTITEPARHVCEPAFTYGGHFLCSDYLAGNPSAPPVADPTGGPAGLKLRFKHASTTQWIDAGGIEWGKAVLIKITTPTQVDMPHVTSSSWEFQVVSPHPEDSTLEFKAKAEIVRGKGDVPLWPPHPLFYTNESPTRTVVDNVKAASCDTASCALADGDLVKPVHASKLVSYGTKTLFVWVNVTELQAPEPVLKPNAWFLYHRNSTGQENITNPFDFQNFGIDKTKLFWALPVDDNGMDSPYADGSKWNFELGASYTTPTLPACPPSPVPCGLSCYGGCADWAATYTITVIASSIELPADQYHVHCLERTNCPMPAGGSSNDDGLVAFERDGRKYVPE